MILEAGKTVDTGSYWFTKDCGSCGDWSCCSWEFDSMDDALDTIEFMNNGDFDGLIIHD